MSCKRAIQGGIVDMTTGRRKLEMEVGVGSDSGSGSEKGKRTLR
jgi:hypothetical protein